MCDRRVAGMADFGGRWAAEGFSSHRHLNAGGYSQNVLTDRRILITGASSGIGRGLALVFAGHGAQVWGVGRDEQRLAEVRASAGSDRVSTIAVDLTSSTGPTSVADALGEEGVDVVIHAAGLLGPADTALVDYPEDVWNDVLAANLTAVQRLHRVLSPILDRGINPTVIALSSTVGREARAGWGAYAISKHALEAWVATLALEWHGRVYSVNPGATRTPMRAAAAPDEDPATLPTAQDIAPIFVRLASAEVDEESGTLFNARDWIN